MINCLSACNLRISATHSEPLHHVLLNLTVGRDVQNQTPGQVSFVITHENVFILDVLQHQQLQGEKIEEGIRVRTEERRRAISKSNRTETHHFFEFELDLLWVELLAERSFPQQHVAVVRQQLRTLWLGLSLHPHTGWKETDTHTHTHTQLVSAELKRQSCFPRTQQSAPPPHPFCFSGSSSLKIVASLTTALYACGGEQKTRTSDNDQSQQSTGTAEDQTSRAATIVHNYQSASFKNVPNVVFGWEVLVFGPSGPP